MKENLRISRDLIQYLEKTLILNSNDLKLKDFDRGFKAGQIELMLKIKALYESQERRDVNA
jgi:hypothetical protein